MIILKAPEVVAYASEHNIATDPSPRGSAGLSRGPGCGLPAPPGFPRLSGLLDNVTVWLAFERVFQAFRGETLVYWNSPKGHSKRDRFNPRKTTHEALLNSHSGCPQPSNTDPPDPLCLPATKSSALPALFPIEPDPPPQRRVRFWFFCRKKFGEKTLITGG